MLSKRKYIYPSLLLTNILNNFINKYPTAMPGITESIGSQTGPKVIPNSLNVDEYMVPTVTK